MIEEEISKILNNNDKTFQWKANQLHKIGKLVYDQFSKNEFQNNLSSLAPTLRNEIAISQQQNVQIEMELNTYDALLQQKEEVEKKYDKFKTELDRLEELKKKNEALKNLSNVQTEITTVTNEKDILIKKHIETLLVLNQVLANTNADLEKQLAYKAKEAANNLSQTLVSLDTTEIKVKFSELGKNVNDLTIDYNDHVNKIINVVIDLEIISKEYDKVIKDFKTHHLENESIFGALKNREGVLHYVQNISNEISERLKKYDSEIKILIEKRDQLPIYQLAEARKYQ